MTLPNFLIIGAQKSGSTWLKERLSQHPDVFIFEREIHFFDKDYNYSKGLDWYRAFFSGVTHQIAIGETTPDYIWANGQGVEGHFPNVHRNIFETIPDVKLIISLQNPVKRAISATNHIIRSGRIAPYHKIDDLLIGNKRHLVEGHGVIDYGGYYDQISAYLEYFDRDQMLILIFEEDIVKNPSNGLKNVCNFLEIDVAYEFIEKEQPKNIYHHSKVRLFADYFIPFVSPLTRRLDLFLPVAKANPSEDVVTELYKLYSDDNEKLYKLLGRRPRFWTLEEDSV